MVKPLIQDSYDPVTEADVSQFEASIGVRLPDDFRLFLLEHNGGSFPADVAAVSESIEYQPIEEFTAIGAGDHADIFEVYRDQDSFLYGRVVPIGTDGMGNQLGIVVSNQDYGSIWFFDHENNTQDRWPPANADRVSDNFSQFANAIVYDPVVENDWRETIPAFSAAERGDEKALIDLLELGVELESRNEQGDTLLICAARARQSQIVRLLLNRGADVRARDPHGATALIRASRSASLDSTKLLIAAGADLNAADNNGDTALLAAMWSNYRGSLYLIEHGAEVNHRNNNGETALSRCTNYVQREYVLGPLIQAGAIE